MKKYALAICLATIHTLMVVALFFMINTSTDGEALMAWYFPDIIDRPTSLLATLVIHEDDNLIYAVTYLWIGILHWGIIGYILQSIVRRLKSAFGTNI